MKNISLRIPPARWLLIPLLLLSGLAMAQERRVTGVVRSAEDGQPLPGVNVVRKGTTVGTVTDANGAYAFTVPSASDSLLFSYIGYQTQTRAIGGATTIDVSLRQDDKALSEVVVVGFGTRRRESLTGSVETIRNQDIVRTPSSTVSGALVGKVAGVNTRMADGRPGASTALQIRNLGTPLFIIDGVQKNEGQFNNLDNNDIESITVLKDASAAIYGVRASNGVVIVTTKRGKQGDRPVINLNSYYGIQNWTRFPKAADGPAWIRAQAESDVNLTGKTNYTPEILQKWEQGTEKGFRTFDWYAFGVQKNVPQSYLNLSTSGGTEKTNYYVALSRISQDGVFRDFNFNRINLQSNIDSRVGQRLRVGLQLNGRIENRVNPGLPGADDYGQPLLGLYRNRPTERPYANDNPAYPATTSNIASNYATHTYDITGYLRDTWKVLQSNFTAEYALPIEGLKLNGLYSYSYFNNNWDAFEYTYDTYGYNEATNTYSRTGGNQNPYRGRRFQDVYETTAQVRLNYDRTFGKHAISAVAGYEAIDQKWNNFFNRTLPTNNYLELLQVADFVELTDTYTEEARSGYILRVNYNFNQRYLIEVAGRYDGSWKFAPGARWGLFPSVSLGWRIIEEPFLKNTAFGRTVTDLKLRVSHGVLGDDAIPGLGPFDWVEGYTYRNGSAVLDGTLITGTIPRNAPITSLSWIRSNMSNVGLDFGLLGNKLTGSFDAFYRKRTGLPAAPYDVLVPRETAIAVPRENLNADVVMGMDGAIRYNGKVNKLGYSVGGNFTFARRRDLYTYKPRFGSSWDRYRLGIEDRWSFVNWGYQVIGQFQSQSEIENYPVNIDGRNNTSLLPGDFIYKDVNGDGLINDMDQRPIGYAAGQLPYLNFGINVAANYGGFDLAFDLTGASLASYARVNELKVPFLNDANSPAYMFEDRWHREDIFKADSPWVPGTYPALRKGLNNHSNMLASDFWLTNVSYIRLRNLELGYTVPRVLSQKLGMGKARVYANAFNLFSIDNMRKYGVDPEISQGSGLQYPQTRVLNLGVNLTF